MSDAEKLIVVAQIAGAFGVKGEARVRSFTEDPEACFTYGPLMDADGKVVITPQKVRPLNEGFGVTPRDHVQREHWEELKGTLLHVPRGALPEIGDADEVYVADLVGCRVVHIDGRELGVVSGAPNYGAGDLIEVKPPQGHAFLLAFTNENFPETDMAARVLRANPEEAYLPDALQRQAPDGGTN